MAGVGVVAVLSVILLIASCMVAFAEAPRDRGDVFCFLVMLVLSVAVAVFLVFVVKGF